MTKFIVLRPNAEIVEYEKEFKSTFKLDKTISLLHLKGIIENKGKGKIELVHTWNICNGEHIHMYGWKKGDMPSQHVLPAPIDSNRLFGDILCFMTTRDSLSNLNEEIYAEFFQNSHWLDQADDEIVGEEEEVDADETIPVPIIQELQHEEEYLD